MRLEGWMHQWTCGHPSRRGQEAAPQDGGGDTFLGSAHSRASPKTKRSKPQPRLAVLLGDDDPNSAFFRSLIPSESRGQSHEKECCAQLVSLMRLTSEVAG